MKSKLLVILLCLVVLPTVLHAEKAGREPMVACALSCCLPGLGQIYNGQWPKAIGFIVGDVAFGTLGIVGLVTKNAVLQYVGGSLGFVVGVGAMVDAYISARDLDVQRSGGQGLLNYRNGHLALGVPTTTTVRQGVQVKTRLELAHIQF